MLIMLNLLKRTIKSIQFRFRREFDKTVTLNKYNAKLFILKRSIFTSDI